MVSPDLREEAKDRRHYVYALVDPRDSSVFYIGKGKGKRSGQHLVDYRAGRHAKNLRKMQRIGQILDAGLEVGVDIIREGLSNFEACRLERSEIKARGASLTNLKQGSRHPLDTCLAQIEDMIARFRTPRQYVEGMIVERGRLPTVVERQGYCDSFVWHRNMRAQIMELMLVGSDPAV